VQGNQGREIVLGKRPTVTVPHPRKRDTAGSKKVGLTGTAPRGGCSQSET
jgi:hypothetical protein